MNSYNSSSTRVIFHLTELVWYVLTVVETILILRLILKMTDANPSASFTNFIYNISWSLAQPFIAVFHITYIQGGVFEWTTLLAMFVYWIVAMGIVRLLLIARPVSTPEADARLKEQDTI